MSFNVFKTELHYLTLAGMFDAFGWEVALIAGDMAVVATAFYLPLCYGESFRDAMKGLSAIIGSILAISGF